VGIVLPDSVTFYPRASDKAQYSTSQEHGQCCWVLSGKSAFEVIDRMAITFRTTTAVHLIRFVALSLAIIVASGCEPQSPIEIHEIKIPSEAHAIVRSPDGSHISWILRDDEGRYVPVIDGEKLLVSYGATPPVIEFTPDGEHTAYIRTLYSGREQVVIDAQEGETWDLVTCLPMFNETGKHTMYGVVNDGRAAWVVDEHMLPGTPASRCGFLAEGEYWYTTVQQDGVAVNIGDRQGRTYPEIDFDSIRVSAEAPHLTYLATAEGSSIVVRDTEEIANHPAGTVGMDSLTITADGSKVVYLVRKGGSWRVYVNGTDVGGPDFAYPGCSGKPETEHSSAATDSESADEQSGHLICTSPTRDHFAYVGSTEKGTCVVRDGVAGPTYESVHDLTFSPDGSHLAYTVEDANRKFVIVDDRKGPEMEWVGEPIFSPDGQHLVYAAAQQGRAVVVHDSEVHRLSGLGSAYSFTFSPNSQHLAFCGVARRGYVVVRDWRLSQEYQTVYGYDLQFSPDSQHLLYTALTRGRHIIVVDGHQLGGYRAISDSIAPSFCSTDTISFVAYRDEQVYWVTARIGH